jgi:hypothetical protein
VSGSGCSNCIAITSGRRSHGANSYGGSISVLHVGAYAWSYSLFGISNSNSNSTCETTTSSDVSVRVSGSGCVNCIAISTSEYKSHGANSYGGSMSVLHVGAYSWSLSDKTDSNSDSNSTCKATSASDVSVHVSGSGCVKCSAISTTALSSYGANSYGGALSAAFIGAYSYSYAVGGPFVSSCSAIVENTEVVRLSITIQDSIFIDAVAASGECCRMRSIPIRT